MKERLKQEELEKIVAEVDNLAQQKEKELDREEVRDILQQLNLPGELLEDALVQLARREALGKQQRNNKWITAGIGIVLLGVIAIAFIFFNNRQESLAIVSVYRASLGLEKNTVASLNIIEKKKNPEVYYRVTLENAPIGERLNLHCNWLDPQGKIANQNVYQTREVTKDVWSTFCRYQFNNNSLVGDWKVEIYLGDRFLKSTGFQVVESTKK